ncbi:MAG: tyrosine-type recombinase/integrase, partial [Actinophytocola sp.]|nr:tyrosine-type recombinase/integrase [Actinophytocola sp.]
RHGGGLVVAEVKSRSGRRTIGLPHPVVEALEVHRSQQADERQQAADLWRDEGWIFTNLRGGPVHPSEDHRAWKALLRRAEVRDARLHDARHTAATVLLVLKVPLPAVMELMGWSDASIAKRYMHVTDEVVAAVAEDVGNHMWGSSEPDAFGAPELTDTEREEIRAVAEALPEHLRERLRWVFPDDDDGPEGALIPA